MKKQQVLITVQKQPMFRVLTRTITHSWHGKQVGDIQPETKTWGLSRKRPPLTALMHTTFI